MMALQKFFQQIIKLKINMRTGADEKQFADYLLKIGDGSETIHNSLKRRL